MFKNQKLIKTTMAAVTILYSFSSNAAMESANSSNQKKYVLIDLGVAYPSKLSNDYGNQKPKSSFYYGIGIGSNFNRFLKIDVTLSQMDKFKFSKPVMNVLTDGVATPVAQDFTSTLLMLNGSVNYKYGKMSPYLTAGLGVSYNQAKKWVTSQVVFDGANYLRFAWDLGLGVDYKINKITSVNLGYKYFSLGKAQTAASATNVTNGQRSADVPFSTNLKAQVISVGLKYSF